MERISSKNSTFIAKRIFPFLWIGLLGFVVFGGLRGIGEVQGERYVLLLPAILFAMAGFIFIKGLTFDLVDDVFDCGDYLLVRNGKSEDRVPFENIVNVNFANIYNFPRATLKLRIVGKFGREVAFCPVSKTFAYSRNEMIDKLINRIDSCRINRVA